MLKRQKSLSTFLRQSQRRTVERSDAERALRVTNHVGDIIECEHMCVYLTSDTWTRGERSEQLADEIREAMDAGIHLLLAYA